MAVTLAEPQTTVTDPPLPPAAALPPSAPNLPVITPVEVNPAEQIVASGPAFTLAGAYAQWAHALPHPGDDLQRDFGLDIYRRMSFDPQVRAALRVLVTGALNQPLNLSVPFPETDTRYKQAQKIRDFCQANLDRLERGTIAILSEMAHGALSNGHKVAEILCDEVPIDDGARTGWMLRDLRTLPLNATAFVQDAYANKLGILARRPGLPFFTSPWLLGSGITGSVVVTNNNVLGQKLWPLAHFAVLTWDEQDNDPRGNSICRSVYGPWWMKQQSMPLLLQYETRFGQPSVLIVLPPNVSDVPGENGEPAKKMGDVMLEKGRMWQGGGVMVVPNGTDARLVETSGAGYQLLLEAITLYDTQIVKGLLSATLAVNEGQHRSGKDATTHQDITNLSLRALKTWLANFTKWQILARPVEWNYGRDALALLPTCELGQTDPEDFGPVGQVVAQLENAGHYNPAVVPTQQRELLDGRLGLPFVPGLRAPAQPQVENTVPQGV